MPDKIKPTQKDILAYVVTYSKMEVFPVTLPVKPMGDSYWHFDIEPTSFTFKNAHKRHADLLVGRGILIVSDPWSSAYRLSELGWNMALVHDYKLTYKLAQIDALEAFVRQRQDDDKWYARSEWREHEMQQAEMEISRIEHALSAEEQVRRAYRLYIAINDAVDYYCDLCDTLPYPKNLGPSRMLANRRVGMANGTYNSFQLLMQTR